MARRPHSFALVFLFFLFLFSSPLLPFVFGLDNGVGQLPPMGWNSWCFFVSPGQCGINTQRFLCNESEIKSVADFMLDNGFQDYGYTYINLDDCWLDGNRSADGQLQPDPEKFPNGIEPVVDYVHQKGFKFGIYLDAGNLTCATNKTGSFGHYEEDAQTVAKWGVDYVKMDWCAPTLEVNLQFPQMSQALNKTGRPIFFQACQDGLANIWEWGRYFMNSWRVHTDHHDIWSGKSGTGTIIEVMANLSSFSGPGAWNDADFLMTDGGGQTDDEYRTEFSFWCLWSNPLLVVTNITDLSPLKKEILFNQELIAIDQDRLARPGVRIQNNIDGTQVWTKTLYDGSAAIILYNSNNATTAPQIPFSFSWLGWGLFKVSIRDLWLHQDLGVFNGSFVAENVPPHAVRALRATISFP